MRPLFSKKSRNRFRRYGAGMLALLLSVAYAVPSMAVCPCCDSMTTPPVQETPAIQDDDRPSCHSVVPTSDGTTEEIASVTEEISTQEMSCHGDAVEVTTLSNACDDKCMSTMQTSAVASPGMIETHHGSSKIHLTKTMSHGLSYRFHSTMSTSPVQPSASAMTSMQCATASVPLRI